LMNPDYIGVSLEFYSALVYPERSEGYYGAGDGMSPRFNVAGHPQYLPKP